MNLNDMMANQLGAVLQDLVNNRSFVLPIHFAIIAANGSIYAGHYVACEFGLDSQFVAEHCPTGVFVSPVNLIFVDSRGEAARVVVEADHFGPPTNFN